MNTEKLEVSGDSKILRWLVDTSLEMTPWLTATSKGLKIDTDKAVQEWERSTGKTEPEKMFIAKKVLREIRFEDLFDRYYHRYEEEEEEEFLSTPMPLPKEAKKILADLKKNNEDLSKEIQHFINLKHTSDSDKEELQETRKFCAKLCRVIDKVHYIQMKGDLNFDIGERYKVAKGSILNFLYISDKSHRYKNTEDAWPLAKRLVKSQADIYFKLESIFKEKKNLEGLSFQDLGISSSLKNLAALEQRLEYVLQKIEYTRINIHESERFFVTLDKQMNVIKGIDTEDYMFFEEDEESSPLDKLGRYLAELLSEISDVTFHLPQEKAREFTNKSRSLMRDLSDVDDKWNDNITDVNFKAVEEIFNWMIMESPFLTLIFSGFLNVVKEDEGGSHISLSPWVAATVTSKKLFGNLPLTYIRDKVSYEIETSEEDEVDTTTLSGRRAWDRAQGLQGQGGYQH